SLCKSEGAFGIVGIVDWEKISRMGGILIPNWPMREELQTPLAIHSQISMGLLPKHLSRAT
ncbi:MAG: hypothetical protein MUE84_11505, partial [Hyphomonas sp.]|nr:hypothetical protein [Hyphomonas sp.]